MMMSFMAGLMICMSAVVYLRVGGTAGAFLFAIGLLTILNFKMSLFTGKAGLLSSSEITVREVCEIWFGNFIGCAVGAEMICASGLGSAIFEPATAIIQTRVGNFWYENLILGILCGILMYVAVSRYADAPYLTIMCVMGFILMGANHCIADMAYFCLGRWQVGAIPALLWTTIGNVVGCNVIPISKIVAEKGW